MPANEIRDFVLHQKIALDSLGWLVNDISDGSLLPPSHPRIFVLAVMLSEKYNHGPYHLQTSPMAHHYCVPYPHPKGAEKDG